MTQDINHIVIVGGGSAGWITAGLLAAEHCTNEDNAITITLVESPNVATLGVGEGTWPSMRNTLDKIGINEFDFIRQSNASFKQGSQFNQWCKTDGQDYYYHPFTIPEGYLATNLHAYWQQHNKLSFADTVNVQSHLCRNFQAPKQLATPQYAGVTNYGYHLDAQKFAAMLQQHCTQKLKVRHVQAHIQTVVDDEQGYIKSLMTDTGMINGDLFVDCSGTKSILLGQHYGVELTKVDDILFNDSAIAAQVPTTDLTSDISSTTIATAQDAGWIWDIALSNRRGTGYTYASRYTDQQSAQQQLIDYIAQSTSAEFAENLTYKTFKFNSGYRQLFWKNNCVAIGMAAGFIEPLEASALAMVELSANMLAEELPSNIAHMQIIAKRFNQRFTYRWQRVIDFVKLHYVLSKRCDSQYWIDNRASDSIPERLQELLHLWQYQPPSRLDLIENEEVFPSASYQYVLYGMGFETQSRQYPRRFDDLKLGAALVNQTQQQIEKFVAGLPSNRQLLNHINNL